MGKQRYIIHADMDAFFAAVEQRDNPGLKDKPVVVGADPKSGIGRGVVSTCSYEARKYGIHSAMPVSSAYKKCPKAVFLPVDMAKYRRVSHQVYDIFYDFSPYVEPVSIDEAFLDISSTYHIFGSPRKTGELIKSRIREKLLLTVSLGISPNKLVSKIASDLEKPDGLIEVKQKEVKDFLGPLDIRKIPGVGKKTQLALNRIGIKRISDINKYDKWQWLKKVGPESLGLWNQANGIDERKVESSNVEKSISKEKTFSEDTLCKEKINSTLMSLCEIVSYRLRVYNQKAKRLTLKIRLSDFTTYTRDVTLYRSTNFVDVIYKEIYKLYSRFRKSSHKKIRLLGVKASKLFPADARDFIFEDKNEKRLENLHQVVNRIQVKFGIDSINRGRGFGS